MFVNLLCTWLAIVLPFLRLSMNTMSFASKNSDAITFLLRRRLLPSLEEVSQGASTFGLWLKEVNPTLILSEKTGFVCFKHSQICFDRVSLVSFWSGGKSPGTHPNSSCKIFSLWVCAHEQCFPRLLLLWVIHTCHHFRDSCCPAYKALPTFWL